MWRVDRQSARWHCDRGGCRRGQQRRARGGSVIGSEVRTRFGVYTPSPRVEIVFERVGGSCLFTGAGRPRARRTGSGTSGAGRRASTLRVAQKASARRRYGGGGGRRPTADGRRPTADGRRQTAYGLGLGWARRRTRARRAPRVAPRGRAPTAIRTGAKRRLERPRSGRATAAAGLIEQAGCGS